MKDEYVRIISIVSNQTYITKNIKKKIMKLYIIINTFDSSKIPETIFFKKIIIRTDGKLRLEPF